MQPILITQKEYLISFANMISPNMTNSRKAALTFFVAAIALATSMLVANRIDAEPSLGSQQNAAKNDAIFKKVRGAIEKNHLTKVPTGCLDLELEEVAAGNNILIGVRELHSTQCGGDPQTSPRLFGVQINSQMNKLWSDATSDDGEMKPIIAP